MKATKPQLVKIHVLLTQLNLTESKKEIVSTYSHGRTESSKELTIEEAGELIKMLSTYDNRDPMRRKIFALAYEAGIIWGETKEDKKMNSIKLNKFLTERGTVKKELSKMSYLELQKTVSQFEKILQHQQESSAAKITSDLLTELNIKSSFKQQLKQL